MPKAQPLAVDIPSDLAAPYVVPEGASIAELDATRAAVKKNAEKLLDENARSDQSWEERIAAAEWLIQATGVMDTRKGELQAAEAEQAERLKNLRDSLGDPSADDDEGDDAAAGGDDEHRDGDEPEGGDGGQSQAGDLAGDKAPVAPVLVASARSVARRAVAAAAASGTKQKVPAAPVQPRSAYLTASSEVAGINAGSTITWDQFGGAAAGRFSSLPDPMVPGQARSKLGIGAVHIPSDEGLVASKMVAGKDGRAYDLDDAIEWALSSERLKQETGETSLVAAGGWCAPSETLYDLVDVTTDDGMVNIAGITVSRGGVRYSLGPDFSAVYSAGQNFTKTEAQAIAGSAKSVVNIPCPTFTDNRMNVDGLYLTGDILSAKGYPEAYADFTGKALKAFAHYVNKQTLADMEALCTAVNLVQGGSPPPYENTSVTTELLGAVELQVIDMRYRNRMSITQLVEVVLPLWAKGTIRSDMAKRAAVSDPGGITDSMIENWFSLRGAAVQWVYDWQDFFANAAGMGAATAAAAWPTQVKFMIYPQGGFVRALSDVIELSAVYDSVLLTTNQYVALFMEQARLTLKRVPDVRVCTVKVYVTGITGATIDYTAKQPTV